MNWKESFARSLAIVGGAFYVISAFLLLFAQDWFFENVGNYPPYNRHYMGDAGSFILVLGLMLLWAAREPARHHVMIALAGIGSLVHAGNHTIEDFVANSSAVSITSNITLFVFAFALLLAAWWVRSQPQGKHSR